MTAGHALTIGDLDRLMNGAPGVQDAPGEALTFSVAGTPIAQPRGRWQAGRVVSTAHPNARRWKGAIVRAATQAAVMAPQPWIGQRVALRVDIRFCFMTTRAERLGKSHTHKPDKDNLEKLVLDAIVKAKLIADDALVAVGTTEKIWSNTSGVHVLIQPATEPGLDVVKSAPDWLKIKKGLRALTRSPDA